MRYFILIFVCTAASILLLCNEQIDRLEVILVSAQEAGLGMDVDIKRMKTSMLTLGKKLDCPVNLVELVDNKFGASDIINSLKALSCSERSLIIFYYSGHGFNNKKTTSRWPTLCTCIKCAAQMKANRGHMPFITGKSIVEQLMLLKKKAALILFDCCNAQSSDKLHRIVKHIRSSQQELSLEPQDDLESFIRLLCTTNGLVIAAAARVGDVAYGDYGVGGLFTSSFLSSIKYFRGNKKLSWENLFNATSERIYSQSCYFGPRTQHPLYKIYTETR